MRLLRRGLPRPPGIHPDKPAASASEPVRANVFERAHRRSDTQSDNRSNSGARRRFLTDAAPVDDPAGWAERETLRAEIASLIQAAAREYAACADEGLAGGAGRSN
jgi:hypothetical protein